MKLKPALLYTALWLTLFGGGAGLMVISGFYLYLSPKLPSVASIRDIPLETPLRIYSSDKRLIGEFGERRRYPIRYDQIPQNYINALIAAEDEDFYSHNGVSIKGLVRAASQLVLTGRKGSGGSTLTMQLTRHVFLSLRRTFSRKFNEILLALRIEKELSKEEILELYVNLMFLGKRAYGISAAAEVYYGKPISELSLAQHAMLVGVLKGPSVLNPINNPERAVIRRNYVLRRMHKLDYIDTAQLEAAIAEPVTATYHGYAKEIEAPYVAEMARQRVIELFGDAAYTAGYQIYTSVRSDLQLQAQNAIVDGVLAYDWRHGYRGPEQQFDLADAPELSPEQENPPSEALRDDRQWRQALQNIPEYGGLVPAVVVQVEEKALKLLMKDGQVETLEWEQGLSEAREYLNENARGARPATASEIAAVGDVIRLRNVEDKWKLAQIPEAEAALVALDPDDGAILALTGGFDFVHSSFNRATQATRQPGSNFKPFIYTAALEHGLTAATIMNDAPVVIADKQLESTWRPENSSGKFYGPTRLRKALAQSRNLVSIRVLERIGVRNAIESLERFGFDSETLPQNLSLALGTHAVTPIEVATGYAAFANGGYRVEPYLVSHIKNFEGDVVWAALPAKVCQEQCEPNDDAPQSPLEAGEDIPASLPDPYNLAEDPFTLNLETKILLGILEYEDYPTAPRVISPQVTYIVDSMLRDVIRRGTGVKAWRKFQRNDIAGKTGTTNGPADAWFTGYHRSIVATTWLGFDQNTPLGAREYGGVAALPIWMDFMDLALTDAPVTPRVQPAGIVSVRINPETGKLARIGDPDAIFEIFQEGTVPESEESQSENPWESEETINEELF